MVCISYVSLPSGKLLKDSCLSVLPCFCFPKLAEGEPCPSCAGPRNLNPSVSSLLAADPKSVPHLISCKNGDFGHWDGAKGLG